LGGWVAAAVVLQQQQQQQQLALTHALTWNLPIRSLSQHLKKMRKLKGCQNLQQQQQQQRQKLVMTNSSSSSSRLR
jgi:hypothetical protein